jgi:hypothetical protein
MASARLPAASRSRPSGWTGAGGGGAPVIDDAGDARRRPGERLDPHERQHLADAARLEHVGVLAQAEEQEQHGGGPPAIRSDRR